jgi:hypothetical protein
MRTKELSVIRPNQYDSTFTQTFEIGIIYLNIRCIDSYTKGCLNDCLYDSSDFIAPANVKLLLFNAYLSHYSYVSQRRSNI